MTAKAIKYYLLKPYEMRRTMCRIALIWIFRKQIYLEYRIAKVEAQDEHRVLMQHLHEIMQSVKGIEITLLYHLRDTLINHD